MLDPLEDGREPRTDAESGDHLPGDIPDPAVKRARDGRRMNPASLQNLPNVRGEASPGSWAPGTAPNLKHGARTRNPQASPEWSPAVQAAIGDLEARVGDELRDQDGNVYPWAAPAIETVAIQRLASVRLERYVADQEARGALKPADLDMQSRIGDRYSAVLHREGLTLTARLDAYKKGFDLARELPALDDDRGGDRA